MHLILQIITLEMGVYEIRKYSNIYSNVRALPCVVRIVQKSVLCFLPAVHLLNTLWAYMTPQMTSNQSINQSIRDCLSSSSKLIVCIKNAGSDDNVRILFSEEPGFKLLTEGRECLRRRYFLRQRVPDTGSSNRERPVTDC